MKIKIHLQQENKNLNLFVILSSGLDLSDSDSGSQPAALTTEDVQSHIKGSLSFGLPKKVVSV